MRNSLIASVLLLLWGCASTGSGERPAGHVVLDREHAAVPSYWAPGEDEIQALESDLARLFTHPDHRFNGPGGLRLLKYGIRYHGTVENGKEIIVGEGTLLLSKSLAKFVDENSQPDSPILHTFGGGTAFFTVYYDPALKKVLRVDFNAAF